MSNYCSMYIKVYDNSFPFMNYLIYCLFFFLVYDIQFSFLPEWAKTRFIISLWGIMYFIFTKKKMPRVMWNFIMLGLGCILLCFFSSFINSHLNFWIIQHFALNCLIYLFASYFLTNICYQNGWSLYDILKVIVYCIVVNNIFAISGLFYLPITDWIVSIQRMDIEFGDTLGRCNGFGPAGNYFGGGATTGLGLILVIYLHVHKQFNLFLSVTLFIFLSFSGVTIARTTLIGSLFSLFSLLFYSTNRNIKVKFLLWVSTILISTYLLLYIFYSEEPVFKFAFEAFLNYENSGEVSTDSTNALKSHWDRLPQTMTTWLIGDAEMRDGEGYYMHTDVGYLRLIFNYGIVGMLFFLVGLIFVLYDCAIKTRMETNKKNYYY